MRTRLNQRFEVYTGTAPSSVVDAIKADLAKFNGSGWSIKQMGVLGVGQQVAAWALWEQVEVI